MFFIFPEGGKWKTFYRARDFVSRTGLFRRRSLRNKRKRIGFFFADRWKPKAEGCGVLKQNALKRLKKIRQNDGFHLKSCCSSKQERLKQEIVIFVQQDFTIINANQSIFCCNRKCGERNKRIWILFFRFAEGKSPIAEGNPISSSFGGQAVFGL